MNVKLAKIHQAVLIVMLINTCIINMVITGQMIGYSLEDRPLDRLHQLLDDSIGTIILAPHELIVYYYFMCRVF